MEGGREGGRRKRRRGGGEEGEEEENKEGRKRRKRRRGGGEEEKEEKAGREEEGGMKGGEGGKEEVRGQVSIEYHAQSYIATPLTSRQSETKRYMIPSSLLLVCSMLEQTCSNSAVCISSCCFLSVSEISSRSCNEDMEYGICTMHMVLYTACSMDYVPCNME